ncbi:MAG: flagellar biosynthetic protein FliO [Lachnospiraceae bacterium]|jgi:flagellar protein FliO/FliZ|nr:flagellar biosynthetic protein FliO [Lachnospiraceae bacterium]
MVLLEISSGWESFFQLVGILLVFLFVLALTYLVTKWIAGYQQGIVANKNIRVIETFRVSSNKFIQIIQVGEKYLAVSVCKDTINVLTELTEEQLTWMPSMEEKKEANVNESFQEILNNLKKKIPRK